VPSQDYLMTVYTWGTKHGKKALTPSLEQKFWGGNVGHAAIKLTFPANDRGTQLIHDFCIKDGKSIIPHEKKITQESMAAFQIDPNTGLICFDQEGNPITQINTIKHEYYEVYFSWWPPAVLIEHIKDLEKGRAGVPYSWPVNTDPALIETRPQHGFYEKVVPKFMYSSLGIEPYITLGPPIKVKYPNIDSTQSTTQLLNSNLSKQLQKEILEDINDISHHSYDLVKPKLEIHTRVLKQDPLLKLNYLYLYEQKHTLIIKLSNDIDFLKKKINKIQRRIATLELEIQTNNNPAKAQNLQQSLDKNKADLLPLREELNTKLHLLHKEQQISSQITDDFFATFKESISKYIEHGKQPDGTVMIPLIDPSIPNDAVGLNLQEILKKMRGIATDQISYGLYTKNCSATILAVLRAGMSAHYMGHNIPEIRDDYTNKNPVVSQRIDDGFKQIYPGLNFSAITPQMVYNAGRQLEKNIVRHNNKTQNIAQPFTIQHKPTDKKRPLSIKELPVDALLFNRSCQAELQKIYDQLNNFFKTAAYLSSDQTTAIKSLNQRRTTIISLVHQESAEEKIPKQINNLNTQIVKHRSSR
jgi:hypothetical protein